MRLYIFKELIKIHKLISDPSAFVWEWLKLMPHQYPYLNHEHKWGAPEMAYQSRVLTAQAPQSSDPSIQGTSWASCTCQDHSSKVDRVRKITGTSWLYSSGEIKILRSGRDPTSKKWMESGHRGHKIPSSGLCICLGMQTHATMNMYIGLHRCADIDRNHRKTTF